MSDKEKVIIYTDADANNTGAKDDSLTAFFMSNYHIFLSFAHNYISDRALCEDIVQEAFVAFVEQRRVEWQQDSVRSFIYTTIRNRALNHLRHQSVRDKYARSAIEYYDTYKESDHFFVDSIISEEASRVVINAVDELPETSRCVINMTIDGMTNTEIAQKLGVSINTVRTHKFRSYKILRKLLSHLRLL